MLRQQLFKQGLALGAFGQGFKLFAVAQAHRAFEAHAAKLARGPSHSGQGFMKAAAGHGHRAQAIALAQHHAEQGHPQVRCRHKHARDMAHLGRGFGVGPDHEAGCIDQAHDGQAMRIAQLHEAGRLVGGIGVDGTAQMQRVVGQHAERATTHPRQSGVNAQAKSRAQLQHTALIGDALHGRSGVVRAQTVFGHHVAQRLGGWCFPVSLCALKKRQVMPCHGHGLHLAIHQHIDHAVAMLDVAWADLLGLENTQATAFDHGGTAHADVAVTRGNDHVAATQQRRIARKATPGHHTHHRHTAIEARKRGKSRQVQAGHDGHIDITGAPTAAFGKQHHRQIVLQGDAQHAVGLLVVAHALRARQHGEVVGHDHDTLAIHATDARDHAVGRCVAHQVVGCAAAALRRHSQSTVFDKRAGVTQIGDVFAGGAQAQSVAFGHRLGAQRVMRE